MALKGAPGEWLERVLASWAAPSPLQQVSTSRPWEYLDSDLEGVLRTNVPDGGGLYIFVFGKTRNKPVTMGGHCAVNRGNACNRVGLVITSACARVASKHVRIRRE